MTQKRVRVFSGARPTGKQHLGNYLGAILNYVEMQKDFDCIYSIVDIHALTTVETTLQLKENCLDMALDWLAAGVDPEQSIVFIQSHVPQVMELHTLLSMVVPMGKLTDLPTFKEKVRMHPQNVNYGLLGYPVLMSADILLYKAELVPVGIDQAPHLEFTREVVRSFNYQYNTQVLLEPQMKNTPVMKVLGTDGVNKMSKSLNNEIEIAADAPTTKKLVMSMVTDTNRKLRSDPGNPDICNVFSFHKMFSSQEEIGMIDVECRRAGIGCVDCKKTLATNINNAMAPFRERRHEWMKKPKQVWEILYNGADRARTIADVTMAEVRDAIGLPRYR
ncbi:MAG: tryptophan--tRNA ligase [Chloroflexi bacterium]|nr:tryptophan--tRNA ligase [Chloroflexota bacterium]